MNFSLPMRRPQIIGLLLLWVGTATVFAVSVPADPAVRSSILSPQAAASGFSKIGPVSTNLWTFNAIDVYDPSLRRDVFYITSFNSAGNGQLIRLDYRNNNAKAWTMPVGIGSWGIIKGQDGNIYLGSYNEGQLLCFNPRTEKWIPLPQAPEAFRKKESIIADVA